MFVFPSLFAFGTHPDFTTPAVSAPSVTAQFEVVIGKPTEQDGQKAFDEGRYADAEVAFRSILRNRPNYEVGRVNLAAAQLRQGKWDEAKANYLLGMPCTPSIINLGLLAMYEGESRRLLDEAVRREPGNATTHHDLACQMLFFGDYEEGWQEYEWRWLGNQCSWRPDPKYAWNGVPNDSCLILPEQGMGDNFQFARYIKYMQTKKRILVVPDALVTPLANVEGVDECPVEGIAGAFASMMSLPRLTKRCEPFWDGTYLKATTTQTPHTDFRIGICWKGNPLHKHDVWRSAKTSDFDPIRAVPGAAVTSLQYGEGLSGNYQDTVNIIADLDLVITVDTSIAHIAGALGIPTFLLLSRIPDWRWAFSGTTTPWYPSFRLFRQTKLLDWTGPINDCVQALSLRQHDLSQQ